MINRDKKMMQKKWIKWPLIVFISTLIFFVGLYSGIYLGFFGKVPTVEALSSINQEEATQVLDKNGDLLGKYYIYDRQPLSFDQFPKHLIDALVATEDARFYEHDGIDNVSLLRVFIKSILLQDKSAGGGSTITLQLAKNLFGRKDYMMLGMVINKFKESIIAKRIEAIYSKEDILTLYLNTVPFSDNTYGIESAARKFFNKPALQLTKPEAATLVGTLKANNYYNPRLHPQRSLERRNVVLNQMAKGDYMPQDSANYYANETLVLDYKSFNHDAGIAPYFREQVKKELSKILDTIKNVDGERFDIYRDGLIVHTTLDIGMQKLAEDAMKEHLKVLQQDFEKSYGKNAPWITNKKLMKAALETLPRYKSYKKAGLTNAQIQDSLSVKRNMELFHWKGDTTLKMNVKDSLQHYLKFLNMGMLSIEPQTGAIRAYIGGIDFRFFKYDHVSQSERQVGSTFKPFVYTAAIENGLKPCSYFSLAEITYADYDNWTPSNSSGKTEDPYLNYNLETALSKSVNTIAVKVLNEVGIPKVLEQVEKLGIKKELPQQPSLALGVAEINLKELTGAYASYVNHSKPVKPFCITKVEGRNGNIIATFEPKTTEPAFSDYTRQVMLEMLKSTVNSGTATRLRTTYKLTNEIAGKTGTTQNNKDGWFVGITPNSVTVTWVGNDNHSIGFKTTGLGQGANSALPIFAKFYSKLNKDSNYNDITKSRFEKSSSEVISDLDCDTDKRDNFIKRLFSKKKKTKKFKKKQIE
jgi:penicillin-binding protein 1A